MQQLGGVVIVFHPTNEVINHILSYASYLDLLLIFDNTPPEFDSSFNEALLKSDLKNIEYICNKQNYGIATCLNKAAHILNQKGFKWMLTMDQDSSFISKTAESYFHSFRQQLWNSTDIGLVALNSDSSKEQIELSENSSFTFINTAITSGSIVQLQILQLLGGFEEKLFIDEVDHEFCFRLRLNNYQIASYQNLYLTHALGSLENKGYLFGWMKRSKRVIHSPKRVYFMVRNHCFVSKKYASHFQEEFKLKRLQLLTTLKNNLFFSGRFFSTLKYICLGYYDFLNNNYTNKP